MSTEPSAVPASVEAIDIEGPLTTKLRHRVHRVFMSLFASLPLPIDSKCRQIVESTLRVQHAID